MSANRPSWGIPGESRPREGYYAVEGYKWESVVNNPIGFVEGFIEGIRDHQLTRARCPMQKRIVYKFDGPYFMVAKEDTDELIAMIAIVDEAPDIYAGIRLSECEYLMERIDEINRDLCETLLRPCAANKGRYDDYGEPTPPNGAPQTP